MDRKPKIREQMSIFGGIPPTALGDRETECSERGSLASMINLRQELRHDIPSTTYLTHGIHNVYPAKFIPQVPRFVIRRFGLEKKIILDPFAGSGTTAVESLVTGNSSVANDINPITKFLIEIKTMRLESKECFTYMSRLNFHVGAMGKSKLEFVPHWTNLSYWYPAEILSELTRMWGYIHNIGEGENWAKQILSAAALHISRKYSYGEDESPKLFRSKLKRTKMKDLMDKFCGNGKQLLRTELLNKARQYLESIIQFNATLKGDYRTANTLNTDGQFLMILSESLEDLKQVLPEGRIDCIITSPPYIYAQEYLRSTKMDMYWLDMVDDSMVRDLTRKEIGQKPRPFFDLSDELSEIEPYKQTARTVTELSVNFRTKENLCRFEAYFSDMLCFVKLAADLLKRKGLLAIFVGEPKVFGVPVHVKDIISEMMKRSHLEVVGTFFDVIKSRHLSRNRLNENPDGISGEWLIIGERP